MILNTIFRRNFLLLELKSYNEVDMLQSVKLGKHLKTVSVRKYGQKKLPADPSHIESVPVPDYKIKSPRDTSVYAWGVAEHGAIGHYIQKRTKMKSRTDPRFKFFKKPLRHLFGEYYKVRDIAAGYGFSAFSIKSSRGTKVWGTGINTDSQIGYHDARANHPLGTLLSPVPIELHLKRETKVIGLSAGRAHLVVVTDEEGAFTLGNNSYGQCGRTIQENEKYLGSRIVNQIPNVGGEKIKAVECGQDHTLFLTENGNVYSCGWGADGQTGLGHYNMQSEPSRVLGDIEGENIVKISSKCDCVLAINDKGEVFGWGNSEYAQIFGELDSLQQINRPIHIKKCKGFGKIIDVAAGGSHCLMLNEGGEVFSWGYGILGQGPSVSQSWVPKLIPPILFGKNDFQPDSTVTSIYCGISFSAAINSNGHIYTWGKNKGGCLGLGFTDDQYFPLRVYLGAVAKKLALGADHMIALCNPF